MNKNLELIEKNIRSINDYPKEGITFRDITPMIKNPKAFRASINELAKLAKGKKIDYVIGVEARGFIFGSALAHKFGVGFVPIRKKGKLPYKVIRKKYKLEYGDAEIEMHKDGIERGSRVIIVDDLLATGGTAQAAARLIEKSKGKVESILFVVELKGLQGRKKLKKYNVKSLIEY